MKALTPLLAAVLLILITIMVASLYIGWVSSLAKQTQVTVENRTRLGIDCTAVKVTIDDVYLDFATNRSRISVKNTGVVSDVVQYAAVFNSFGQNATNLTSFPFNLTSGLTATIEFNITGYIPACGNFSKAIVSTQCVSRDFTGTPKNC